MTMTDVPTTRPVTILKMSERVSSRQWAELAALDPDLMVTQSPEWTHALVSTRRFEDSSRLYELSDGRRFVVPMVRRSGRFEIAAQSGSFPNGWGFGGLVGPGIDRTATRLIVADVMASGLRVRVQPNPRHAEFYAGVFPDGTVARRRQDHVAPLPDDVATMWHDVLGGKTRRSIMKAERDGVTVERASDRLLPVCHDLFHASVERWAGRQHEPMWLAHLRADRRDPLSKWDAIARQLGDRFGLWIARIQGEPIGAIVVMYGPTAHYCRSVMRKELAGPARANYLLLWRAVEEAIERGCTQLHMGESGWSPGLAGFKEQFGAEAIVHHDYLMERVPVSRVDQLARTAAKRVLRFED